MFLGVRDIRRAWGRFSLLGTVVALIVLLLVMLTGLTGGLGKQNTSALEALDPQRYVFSPEIDFVESTVSEGTEGTEGAWRATPGVEAVTPLGVSQPSAHWGETTAAVAVFGLPAGSRVPGGGEVPEEGVSLPVAGAAPEEYYSHLPVAWVSLNTWKEVAHSPPPPCSWWRAIRRIPGGTRRRPRAPRR
ncbi:hypothetical protein [Corynebacterium mastitidis]|uniref:hypothetical protein n=1 Tax=Corynebacterium mastitidis TaxID=161890 RepID=UPI003D75FE3F